VARDCARRATGSTGEEWTSLDVLSIEAVRFAEVFLLALLGNGKVSFSMATACVGSKEREGDLLRAMAETFEAPEVVNDADRK
jgi:hypothetical protein